MSDDLVKRLRNGDTLDIGAAADTIERLAAEVAHWKSNAKGLHSRALAAEAEAARLREALVKCVEWMNPREKMGAGPRVTDAVMEVLRPYLAALRGEEG